MFRRKTLKRLTRFGLCLYAFVYCMALTVCAEPCPVLEMTGQNTAYAEENANTAMRAEAIPIGETAVIDDSRSNGTGPDGLVIQFDGNTTEELNQIINCEPVNKTLLNGTQVFLNLSKDVYSHGIFVSILPDFKSEKPMALTINGNGHKIQGGNTTNNIPILIAPAHNQIVDLVIANCTITGRNAPEGSAVIVEGNNSLSLQNVTFEYNSGDFGGAVGMSITDEDSPASLRIENCVFLKNTAADNGGAVYVAGSNTTISIRNSTFINNNASTGGAVSFQAEPQYYGGEIRDCTFTNNTALCGGAVYDGKGAVSHLNRNAFFMNEARDGDGSAIYASAGGFVISNSLFYGNTNPEQAIKGPSSPENLGSDANGPEEAKDGAFDIGANWYGNMAGNYTEAPVVNGTTPYSWYWMNMTDEEINGSCAVGVDFRNLYWENQGMSYYHNVSENVGDDCGLVNITLHCEAEGAVLTNNTVDVDNGYGIISFAERPEDPFNLTVSVPGTSKTIMTKEFEGFGPDESKMVTVNKTFGDLPLLVKYNMSIPYTGIKLKPKNVKETEKDTYVIEDLTILLSSLTDPAFLDRTVPKFKFYNSKNVIPAGKKKQSYFTVTLTPDPKLQKEEKKEVKKRLKKINKDLKKEKFVFVIEPLDLAAAENPVPTWNKKGTKVPKVTASWKGRSHVLKQKKDYTAEIKGNEVKLTGKGNFAGVRVLTR